MEKIIAGKRMFAFKYWDSIQLEVNGKPWVVGKITDKLITFVPAPMGGFAGTDNYLKQWRAREGHSQAKAAAIFGVSQSMIAKIESGDRSLTVEMFEKIRQDNRIYEKD